MQPHYPFPWKVLQNLVPSALVGASLNFGADARTAVAALKPPIQILHPENIPQSGPCLITSNHFSGARIQAWWFAMAISAATPTDVHWIITAAWTFNGNRALHPLTPISRWAFNRVARVYGFWTMPPMPPSPKEVQDRAQAVRRVLTAARSNPNLVIGMAPEGQEFPGRVLGWPPPGTGRFLLHIAERGFPVVPVAYYHKDEGFPCLAFGSPYRLSRSQGLPVEDLDRQASQTVMQAIAQLLPSELRGPFG